MRPWSGVKFIKYDSLDEWLALRKNLGVGGSESAGIMGMSPYTCAARVFYEKLGLTAEKKASMAMIIGTMSEDLIAKLWSHYDPQIGPDSILRNQPSGRVVRKPQKLNRIVVSQAHPHLFSSTDRLFYDENGNRCLLELKTIGAWEEKKWESGIPPHYLVQVQHYMLVLGVGYAELAILAGGRDLSVVPFETSQNIQDAIVERTFAFNELLVQARAILDAGGSELDIQHLVPGPDGSDAYTDFLRERSPADKINTDVIEASTEDYRVLKELVAFEREQEKYKAEVNLRKQILMSRLQEANTLSFGEVGRITFRADKNGVRSFKKNLKEDALLGL